MEEDLYEPPRTFDRPYGLKMGKPFQCAVFKDLHEREGSGWYDFSERLGLGGIFRLTSAGVIPFNQAQEYAAIPWHDEYDILRAVEQGHIRRLEPVKNETLV